MPAQNIGTIDLLADTESFDEARLPVSAEVDARWRGRAITGAGLLKIASSALLLTGEDAPAASLLIEGRRAFYFRTDANGEVTDLYVSLDGEVWKEVATGGDTFTQGTGIRITDNGDGTKTIAVTRPLTRAQQIRINQLTDDYINALIAAGDHWRERFTIRYSGRFPPIIGPRWRQETQRDGTGHLIRIVPSGADLGIIQAVRAGSKIQVRTTTNVVLNVFTVESDPADPDADGVWQILGDWDQVRTFNGLTNYVLYFSESRRHAIETDDETTEGDGTPSDPVKVKRGGIRNVQISGSLTDTQKRNVRSKIGSVTVTAAEDVPRNPLEGDLHIYSSDASSLSSHVEANGVTSLTSASARDIFKWNGTNWVRLISALELPDDQTAEEIRDALETLTGNARLPASAVRGLPGSFYEYANRSYVADADRDTGSEIAIGVDTGTVYDLKIARDSDLYHLPDVNTGVQVRITQRLKSWAGRVIDRSVSSGLYTIKIDFHQRRGTFATGSRCKVEIGAIPTNQRTYIYGENQTERFPSKRFAVADYGITTHGLKQFKGRVGETFNGGIDFTVQDQSEASDIDSDISTNVRDCIIRIDEDVPRCRIKFSFRSRDNPSGLHFMQLKRVDSGGDDGLVLAAQGHDFTNRQSAVDLAAAGSIYEADEDDIELSIGDQLYLRAYGLPTRGTDSITVGYILFERQE